MVSRDTTLLARAAETFTGEADVQLYRVHEQPVVRPGTLRLRTSTQCPRNASTLKFATRGFPVLAIASYVGHWAA